MLLLSFYIFFYLFSKHLFLARKNTKFCVTFYILVQIFICTWKLYDLLSNRKATSRVSPCPQGEFLCNAYAFFRRCVRWFAIRSPIQPGTLHYRVILLLYRLVLSTIVLPYFFLFIGCFLLLQPIQNLIRFRLCRGVPRYRVRSERLVFCHVWW